MATDLETRKTSFNSNAYLQRKFAELCARIKRVDLLAHLLALTLTVLGYAFAIGLFDWAADHSRAAWASAVRWTGFLALLGVTAFLLVRIAQCAFRRVSPYYVADQIEQTLPDAKNILINWLDLQDEKLPSAFQKSLSSRAAEQLQESDSERTVHKRKGRILLAVHAVPVLGLVVLLILGPSALAASLLRAFAPFYVPEAIAGTQIHLQEPAPGDVEVSPAQSITFIARIEGRVRTGIHPDAPRLSYRYQSSEDYQSQPLQPDGAGTWTAQLHPTQIRTGFSYKISAGDAETPEYQVRVRTRAHVKKFEITYQHRPYRQLPRATITFPNPNATRPSVLGPPGAEVELVVHASRPVRTLRVEFVTKSGTKTVSPRKLPDDAFACTWTLDQPGQFRVVFTSMDGEENRDRDWHEIVVRDDEAPVVLLTQPGKDVQLPENGTLELEGRAGSNVGVKSLTLQMRVVDGPSKGNLPPRPYRPEISFKFNDEAYPLAIDYKDFVALDQFKNDKGTTTLFNAGTVIEYWLEAADCTDTPSPMGNIGRSSTYKITLTPAQSPAQQETKRKDLQARQKKHQAKQDSDLANQKKDRTQNPKGENGPNDPQEQQATAEKEKKEAEEKIKKALDEKNEQDKKGGAKGSGQENSAAKEGPPNSPDAPQPDQKPGLPDDAGDKKDLGNGDGSSGESKDGGDQEKKSEPASKGERKDGPKESLGGAKDGGPMAKDEPAGGAKDSGPTGMDTPTPAQPKEQAMDDGSPMPTAKDSKGEPQTQGNAKGIEQNGPDLPNKNDQGTPPLNSQAKSAPMNDAGGDAKDGPSDKAKQPGTARGGDVKAKSKEPAWDEVAQMIEQLSKRDGAEKEAEAALKNIEKNSSDPRKREIAKEALDKNRRDPKAGQEEKKVPNPFGTAGKSPGIGDDVKAAIANREFTRRIGQMQLDDWKNQMTPDLLKKAGMSEADWQRFLKNAQAHDARVQQLNAKLMQKALKDLRGGVNPNPGGRVVEGGATNTVPLDAGQAPPPPDLLDVQRRFSTRP